MRPGAPRPLPALPRPAIDRERTRAAQAATLTAVTLRHPWLLQEVEESYAGLDLGEGPVAQCRTLCLAWLAEGHALDSGGLMDHLAQAGMGEYAAALLRDPFLPLAAQPDAQPKEALDGWWHFFGLLRGEADLLEDLAAAERAWNTSADPEEQRRAFRRQVHLRAAINALRRGEWDEVEPPAETAAGGMGNIPIG